MMENFKTTLRNEFRLEKLFFTHSNQEDFYKSQWLECHPVLFLALRAAFALYQTIVYIYSVAAEPWKPGPTRRHFNLAFITRWTYALLTAYQLVAFVVALIGFYKSRERLRQKRQRPRRDAPSNEENQTATSGMLEIEKPNAVGCDDQSKKPLVNQGLIKLHWLLYEATLNSSFIISLMYWGFVHKSEPFKFDTYAAHAFNSVMMVVDFSVNAVPVRLLHVVYTMVFSTVYVIFTVIYFAVDPENNVLYLGVLDWRRPGKATVVCLCLVFLVVPLFQTFWFVLYRIKLLVTKIHNRSKENAKSNGQVHNDTRQ
ncbi:protein rolling stone-like [Tubulanus polymorphus]|uniref:protein rolling stone-like n=1 Tax=Tubulanus polymorphus TaxID=672921 RepID=UPI003DA25140